MRDPDDYWRRLLSGEEEGINRMSRFMRRLPSPPRCKICMAPFEGPYAPVLKVVGFRRWALNQQLCRWCVSGIARHQGGAEVEVSLLYSDVRGSTTLAETLPPAEFTRTLNGFFRLVSEAVDAESGVIDHIVGDGVMAMWIPGFVGDAHATHAVSAGRRLAKALLDPETATFPAGVGVHTGTAFVGVVGEPGSFDFTVMGDVANTAARIGSAAAAGELMLSEEIVHAAALDTTDLTHRMLTLRGKTEPAPVWVEAVPQAV